MKRGKLFVTVITFLFLLSSLALANGLNLNGFGARAAAMGGAFIGLADDFTALFWNPAGIAQFKQKTFGFAGELISPSGEYQLNMGSLTLVDAQTKSKLYPSFLTAYYHPINEKLVAGIGIYTPSGLGAKWDGADFAFISASQNYKWESYIGVVTFSPTVAYQASEQISVGATLNINYGFFNIARHAGIQQLPTTAINLGQYEETSKGWGFGATFGLLAKPSDKLSMGLTFRTPSTVNMSGTVKISNLGQLGVSDETEFERSVTSPMWFGGGLAFKPIDDLTLTFDIHYTNWGALDELEAAYEDPLWQGFMEAGGENIIELQWEDKIQIRFGAEYRMNNVAFRAGYYKDPAPAPDATMNVLMPNYDFNSFTIGIGYKTERFQIDYGLEYLIGKERNIGFLLPEAQPGIYNMKILVPMISITFGL